MTREYRRALTIFFLALCAIQPPASAMAPAEAITGTRAQKVDRYLSRLEALGFSGVVLVAADGKVILSKGYGLANRERNIPYTPETVFDIGSITKQFTAAAILRLEMQGELRVADPISRYFENVPEDKRTITLHHLLTHTSGLEGGFGDDYEEMPRDALAAKALASTLLWAPGTRFSYSNAGYSLLGAVIEKVSGQSYEVFLHEQLFRPAGMQRTGYLLPNWKPDELAHGYRAQERWGSPLDHHWAPDGPWWNLRANGGILSTVGDLYKWHQALESEAILSNVAKAKYFAAHIPNGDTGYSQYAYGWDVSRTPRNTKLISHTGGNGIFAADFRRYVDDRRVIIAGSAQSDFQSFWITNGIADLLFDLQTSEPPAAARVTTAALARYTGTYALPAGGKLLITNASTVGSSVPRLRITPEGRDAFELLQGGVGRDVRARMTRHETRLIRALDQTRQGHYESLASVYGVPQDQVREREQQRMSDLERRFGPLLRWEILGTSANGDRVSTWLSFVLKEATQVYEYVWEGAEIVWVKPAEGVDRLFFVAESQSELVSYDPRTLQVRRLEIVARQDGNVNGLIVNVGGEVVRAQRNGAPAD